MIHSWKKLMTMTGGKDFVIKKVSVPSESIDIEGEFELPPLGQLDMDEQIFVAAFIKTHGSIKQMEKIFGISYPTVKNRLNQIASKIGLIDVSVDVKSSVSSVIDKLERGEIEVESALKELE
ncbi:MAG: DUF2089 family protein [Spirochaetales bacterium]|nr:DUF2089 family protein [Spirochaetales bacterium]